MKAEQREHHYFNIGDRVASHDGTMRGTIRETIFEQTPSPYEDIWWFVVLRDDGSLRRCYDDEVRKLTPLELLAEV